MAASAVSAVDVQDAGQMFEYFRARICGGGGWFRIKSTDGSTLVVHPLGSRRKGAFERSLAIGHADGHRAERKTASRAQSRKIWTPE